MSGYLNQPSDKQRNIGYFLLTVKEFINGFDNVSGFIKLPLWIMGIAVTSVFAPYILGGGVLFSFVYVLQGIYLEKERNVIEQEKIREQQRLSREILKLEEQLTKQQQNPLPFDFTKPVFDTAAANRFLLISLLREYFELEPGLVRKKQKILKLIHDTTGLNPNYANFHHKAALYFKDSPDVKDRFHKVFPEGQYHKTKKNDTASFFKKKFKILTKLFKDNKILRKHLKTSFDFITDFGAGTGIILSLLSLYGIAITWPFIVLLVGGGLAYSLLSLSYQKISADRAKRNLKALDENINHQKIGLQLTKQILKLKKESSLKLGIQQHDYAPFNEDNLTDPSDANKRLIAKAKIPLSSYFRMVLGIASQIILSASIGITVAYGFIWIAGVFFPALPILMPTLTSGLFFSFIYLYRGLKNETKSIKAEFNKYQELAETQQFFSEKFHHKPEVQAELNKDDVQLLKELIQEYLTYANHRGKTYGKDKTSSHSKLFTIIENVANINRGEDNEGNLLPAGDDNFYNQLALFLKGNSKYSVEANLIAQKLKDLCYDSLSSPSLTEAKVNADNAKMNKPGFWDDLGELIRTHTLAFMGTIAIGIMLSLFLAGPQAIIIGAVTTMIATAYCLSAYTSSRHAKNIQSLNNQQLKFALIEKKQNIMEKNRHCTVMSKTYHTRRQCKKIMQPRAARPAFSPSLKSFPLTMADSRGKINNSKPLGTSMIRIWAKPKDIRLSLPTNSTNFKRK